jgi:hypothetical protein
MSPVRLAQIFRRQHRIERAMILERFAYECHRSGESATGTIAHFSGSLTFSALLRSTLLVCFCLRALHARASNANKSLSR